MESNIGEMIQNSLDSIRQVAGAETIIGEPITTPAGVTIIPVSKVSVGFATGGFDTAGRPAVPSENNKSAKPKGKSFGGGGGTGLTVTPVAFLIVSATGTVDLLNIAAPTPASNTVDSVSSLLEKSPDILKKLKDIFSGNSKKESDIPTQEEQADL